ncbi:ADP-ribose pyrophosphatase YjhB, NUDIX family [Paraoerskovia marina]|uniref:ADP-ribose pyrophosphatase YjhB, NUDIX family n=2 Tax=Paraoerskovia marina TaxID=545619 RepID=A0A1H1N3A1_9CELL|nr:ADP-ribose pyrophosphatase YjhB, NUDIX family [Paraoerskovia marina]
MHIDPHERRRRVAPPTPQPVVDEVSAGGVVVDLRPDGPHVAVIARRNRGGRLEWCLPKGHLEGEETAEEAAVREIAEETGIDGVVRRPLGTIDYWFAGDHHRVHKVVHHFLLDAVGGYLTIENDPDHEAEDVAWIAMRDLPDRLAYPNERRLVAAASDILAGLEVRYVRGTVSRATRARPRDPDENGTDAP